MPTSRRQSRISPSGWLNARRKPRSGSPTSAAGQSWMHCGPGTNLIYSACLGSGQPTGMITTLMIPIAAGFGVAALGVAGVAKYMRSSDLRLRIARRDLQTPLRKELPLHIYNVLRDVSLHNAVPIDAIVISRHGVFVAAM